MSDKSFSYPIFFYDGECGFCQRSVTLLANFDQTGLIHFAPLQGETARQLRLSGVNIDSDLSQVNYLTEGKVFRGSRAFFEACKKMRFPLSLCSILNILPEIITQSIYQLIAGNRDKLSGACPLIEPELKMKLLP